ncbi:MAG: hypothetical protein PHQ41_04410 [Candidatus Cloacimonetes bacterium]|nr:hypothetical protein [Candidatus Cloacimonadota bacterium]
MSVEEVVDKWEAMRAKGLKEIEQYKKEHGLEFKGKWPEKGR